MVDINWQEVSVKVKKEAVDAVSYIFTECGAGGVMIEDPEAVKEHIAANSWDAFEFPEELLNRDFVKVTAYFPCNVDLPGRLDYLKIRLHALNIELMPESVKELDFSEVKEEDWANSWKAYYKPVKVGEKILIKPTWEKYDKLSNELVIELDPGMAFGTGTHATTTMCIKALEHLISGGERVFDIGTGSGILAIVAAKLGASTVTAVDLDRVAVAAALENVQLNQVEDHVKVLHGNLLDNIDEQADIVVANIIADVIKLVCPDAAKAVRAGGYFLTSGIIAHREEDVLETLQENGFQVKEVYHEGEWVAVLAVREV